MALPIFSDMGEIQNQVRVSEIRYALYRFSSADKQGVHIFNDEVKLKRLYTE